MTDNPLIEFPCDFPIKIIGIYSVTFYQDIIKIVVKHFPDTEPSKIVYRQSKGSHYAAITATVYPYCQEELDALYQELTHYPGIKMVL